MTNLAATTTPNVGDSSARPDLRVWHASSWGGPLAVFSLTFGLWVGLLAMGVWSPHWWVRLALVAPLTLLSGQLFTLGHDAAHGSFSTSRTVNALTGRLALLPSVHVFGLWRFHHDLHHRYTNLRGRDFVWTPLAVGEYRALPPWRRWLHRLERHPSGFGLGLHYAVEIWARGPCGSGAATEFRITGASSSTRSYCMGSWPVWVWRRGGWLQWSIPIALATSDRGSRPPCSCSCSP